MPTSVLQVLIALGGATLLIYWISPAILLAGLFLAVTATTLPKRSLPGMLLSLGWGQRLLLVAILGAILGASLAALQTILYRLLEGYMLPGPLRSWLTQRQLSLKKRLRSALSGPSFGMHSGLLLEKLRRYPISDAQVAPTRLGNALRALESYSYEQFRLDMIALYEELTAMAPESVRGLPERRKASVDLFVNLIALSVIFGVATTVFGILYSSPMLLVLLSVYGIIAITSYRLAVITCDRWRRAIEAMVNLGRKPLAEALGYSLPIDSQQERRFWMLVVQELRYGYDPDQEGLALFRQDGKLHSSQDELDQSSQVEHCTAACLRSYLRRVEHTWKRLRSRRSSPCS
jgi:hypothetical protein